MDKTKLSLAFGLLLTAGFSQSAFAGTTTGETEHYLVIATGGKNSLQDHVEMSNVEIGANQEFLSVEEPSLGGSQLLGKFKNSGTGFGGGVTLNDKGIDISATNLAALVGKDYRGNVALIGENAKTAFSNVDINAKDSTANSGVLCANFTEGESECEEDNTAFFKEADPNNPDNYDFGVGATSGVDFSGANGLINDLVAQREWILGLTADVIWTDVSQFNDSNEFEGGDLNGVITTSTDGLNTQTDGINADYIVIDLNLGGNAFVLNNLNWVIDSELTVIFRMVSGTNYQFKNSSIMLSDTTATKNFVDSDYNELGAIFYQDAYNSNSGTNSVFDLSNVVLGGIGLWDFTDFNPNGGSGGLMYKNLDNEEGNLFGSKWIDHDTTEISMDNAQGCGQFISNTVDMSNARWSRCSLGQPEVTPHTEVPEPSTLILFALGLFGLRYRAKHS
ncbi:MAG: PEP-CTERM sorting domain-containing protein [Colwellia sp.]|nr:PEP-CTERM sorting domain-containing protein [Colwellia sp.]